jgi:predicted lysophospholipase L1 biosynthesis ABC-type transport system permease subunit
MAGFLVLMASLAASVDTRLQEAALLRALGAKRQQLQTRLGIELGILGLWAGLLAVLLTEIMSCCYYPYSTRRQFEAARLFMANAIFKCHISDDCRAI